MREYSFDVSSSFQNGLRPFKEASLNVPYLEECKGLRPSSFGLTTEQLEVPVMRRPSVWPFPQVYQGNRNYLIDAGALNIMNDTFTRPQVGYSLVGTGSALWRLADGFNSWIVTNGINSYVDGLRTDPNIPIASASFWRSRFVLAGFNLVDFSRAFWTSETLRDQVRSEGAAPNVVMWGRIGAPASEMFQEPLLDSWRARSVGYVPIDDVRRIYHVLPLGPNLIIYGDTGVYALSIDTDGNPRLSPVTKIAPIDTYGIGGSAHTHIFIGTDSAVYSIGGNLQVTEYGFREHLIGPHIPIENRENGLWYLSGPRDTGVLSLTPNLGMLDDLYTGIFLTPQGAMRFGSPEGEVPTRQFLTSAFDMNRVELKTITSLQVFWSGEGTIRAAVQVLPKGLTTWRESTPVTVNADGYVRIQVTGTQFRLKLWITSPEITLPRVEVRWHAVGRQYIRGTSARPADL